MAATFAVYAKSFFCCPIGRTRLEFRTYKIWRWNLIRSIMTLAFA